MKRRQTNMNELKRIFDTKRMLLAIAMMIALPSLILCQTNGKDSDKKSGSEQAVRQTLDNLAAALGKNDIAALDRIYADNYTFVGDTGMIMTKAVRLAAFKSGELKYESVSHEVVSFYLFGDTATVITRYTTKMALGVKFSDGKFLTSLTFVKLKGRWQLVAAHNTRTGE